MDMTLLILVLLVLIAMVVAFWKGRWQLTISGFKQAGQTLRLIWIRLLLGVMLGGLLRALVPSTLIAEWLGPASGLKGILIASYAGIIISGGPYITLPIVASIYAAGAGVGPTIALLASVNMLGLQPLFAWQMAFLGAKIPLIRYAICFFLPPIIGLAGDAIYRLLTVI
mgnify:CR=1 FL=1